MRGLFFFSSFLSSLTSKKLLSVCWLAILILNSCGQTKTTGENKNRVENEKEIIVGGPCDECYLMYEGMPKEISSETTIADKTEPGERLEINGKVVRKDGSPAKDIILYLYHTNAKGYYAPSDTQTVARRNGHLRGWIKTNSKGEFHVSTIRPAPYPNRNVPAHIHILVKEPGKIRYYIDEVWFDDDLLITKDLRENAEKRGGDQIIHLTKSNDALQGEIKIILGQNIPEYH